jgi:hypothetical protein
VFISRDRTPHFKNVNINMKVKLELTSVFCDQPNTVFGMKPPIKDRGYDNVLPDEG